MQSEYTIRIAGYERSEPVLFNLFVLRGHNEWKLQRRFSSIVVLERRLSDELRSRSFLSPLARLFLPALPRSRAWVRQRIYGAQNVKFLEKCMEDIQIYFDKVLQITSIEQSQALGDFLFSDEDMNVCGYYGDLAEYVKAILALPSINHTYDALQFSMDTCPICCDDLEPSQDGRVCVLPCGHAFHASCISKWLSRKNQCCMCRQAVIHCSIEARRECLSDDVDMVLVIEEVRAT